MEKKDRPEEVKAYVNEITSKGGHALWEKTRKQNKTDVISGKPTFSKKMKNEGRMAAEVWAIKHYGPERGKELIAIWTA